VGFYILGVLIGFRLFIESFVAKVFHGDLGTMSNLLTFAHPQTTFVIFSLCYAQCPNYSFCIVFPTPYILQHYVKFDTLTIVMLEKLLGARSFGDSINHIAYHQTIISIYLGKFSLPSIVWIVALTLFGCWALINLAFNCF
jgi:hypothetical protein